MDGLQETQRRLKVVSVPRDLIFDVVTDGTKPRPGSYLAVTNFEVPEGAKVRETQYDFLTGSFQFIIEHPSFAPVPPGERIPYHPDSLGRSVEVYKLAKKKLPGVVFHTTPESIVVTINGLPATEDEIDFIVTDLNHGA